jgi:hypothetical protein
MFMTYIHLYVDDDVERAYLSSFAWHRRFLKWLSQFSPFLVYYELPYGRVSLESQLKKRAEFPAEEWHARGIKRHDIEAILAVIASELNLPNEFLIPRDPIKLVMTPDYDDLPLSSVRHGLRSCLGANFELDELAKLVTDPTVTVEAFVRAVSLRRPRSLRD